MGGGISQEQLDASLQRASKLVIAKNEELRRDVAKRLETSDLSARELAARAGEIDARARALDTRARELDAAKFRSTSGNALEARCTLLALESPTENATLKQNDDIGAVMKSKQDMAKRELSERIKSGYSLNGIPLIDFENLELDKDPLGEGTFGVVYKGIYTNTQSAKIVVAAKKMKDISSRTQPLDDKQYTALLLECKGMIQVSDHPNVVNIYGYSLNIYISSESSFDAQFDAYLVMERCEESLWDFIQRRGASLDNKQFHGIADQIAQGMTYVAEQKIIHRDLRSANILMKENGKVIKIGDFGLSRNMEQSLSTAKTVYVYRGNSNSVFPSFWAAPESIDKAIWTEKSDIWSYGVVMIEMYSAGKIPSHAMPPVRRKGLMPFEQPPACPDTIYEDLIVKCWEFDPKNRPTFRKISAIVAKLHHAQFLKAKR